MEQEQCQPPHNTKAISTCLKKKFFYTGLTELLQGLHIEVQTADATIMECMKKLFANLGTLDSNDNDTSPLLLERSQLTISDVFFGHLHITFIKFLEITAAV